MTGAGLLAAMGVFNLVGTTGSGWLSDRVDSRILLAIFYGLRGLSLIYLPCSFVSLYGLSVFTAFYGLDWFATVAPTVRLISNAFGKEKTGIVYGWIFVAHQIGGVGSVLRRRHAGEFRQLPESFVFSGLLCLVAAVMADAHRRAHKDGATVLARGVRRKRSPISTQQFNRSIDRRDEMSLCVGLLVFHRHDGARACNGGYEFVGANARSYEAAAAFSRRARDRSSRKIRLVIIFVTGRKPRPMVRRNRAPRGIEIEVMRPATHDRSFQPARGKVLPTSLSTP